MSDDSRLEALTIAPRTLLAALVGMPSRRRGAIYDMLFSENGSLLYPTVQRLWNDRIGGLVLYALGVRTIREMERVARQQRLNRR